MAVMKQAILGLHTSRNSTSQVNRTATGVHGPESRLRTSAVHEASSQAAHRPKPTIFVSWSDYNSLDVPKDNGWYGSKQKKTWIPSWPLDKRFSLDKRSSSKNLLKVTSVKLASYGHRCFSFVAPNLWNSLLHNNKRERLAIRF